MMSGSPATHPTGVRRPAFAIERVIGASHKRSGKPCQDEAGVWAVADAVAVAVADGHGTSKHADVGARLAVHVALAALVRFGEELGDRSARLSEVQKYAEHPLRVQIVREWAARVRAKAGDDQAPLLDYGSTLIFALSTARFLLIGQIGDGDVLLVDGNGTVTVPLPPDPSAFADETPSLCLPEAWHSVRVRALPPPEGEALLLLSTDGYSKSYATDATFRQIGPDYLDLVRDGGVPSLTPHLRGFLEQVTTQGSGDDIAFALLHWPPLECAAAGETPVPSQESEPRDVETDASSADEIRADPEGIGHEQIAQREAPADPPREAQGGPASTPSASESAPDTDTIADAGRADPENPDTASNSEPLPTTDHDEEEEVADARTSQER